MLSHTLRGRASAPTAHLPGGWGGRRPPAAGPRSPGDQAAREEPSLLELEKKTPLCLLAHEVISPLGSGLGCRLLSAFVWYAGVSGVCRGGGARV